MDNITCFESFGPKCRFPKSITPNNAIAADAVFYTLIVYSALCIIGTLIVSIHRFLKVRNKEWTKQESTIISTITAGLADGLLITSITFSLSCIIQRHRDNITAYHYDLVCYLSLAATFTSITASFSTPVLAEKRFPSGVRLVGYFLAIGLLGGILGPITKPAKAGHTFPARAPTLDLANLKQSALVLQASCFIETNVTKECTYKTDQTLLPLLTGYVLISIIIFATVGTSINQLWRNWWYDGDSQTPIKEVALLRLMFELTAVLFSTAVSAVAFWQFYTLRKYMSKSGWLSNETELGVSSFGQLLPILQVLFIFLVIANSFEDYITMKDFEDDN